MPRITALRAIATAIFVALPFVRPTEAQSPMIPLLPQEVVEGYIQAAADHLDYLPGEVIVKFKPGVTLQGQQRALTALRSRPDVSALQWMAGTSTALYRDRTQPNARILAEQLTEQPEVAYAEPNYLMHVHAVPNDPSYSSRQWNFSAINMPGAWDISAGGSSSTIVAIVDTGVTTSTVHNLTVKTWDGTKIVDAFPPVALSPDHDAGRFVSPVDFTGSLVTPSTVVYDLDGHGTHTSSTVGESTNNSLAEAGIAYNAKIMPVKVCVGYWDIQFQMSALGIPGFTPETAGGTCSSAAVAAGIRWAADHGANVINLSLGGPQPSQTELDALTYAVQHGVFVAISAGNSYDTGNVAEYPAAFAPTLAGVVSVAAVGRSLNHAYYSTSGPYVELAAPGGDVKDGGSAGEVWQATLCPFDSDSATVVFPRFDRYCEVPNQGTSMAAPHVAGAAALLVSRGIKDPATIEALLTKTAKDLGTPGRDDFYGYGLIQPRTALFGFGIIK
jgi:serine protease